MQAIADTGLGPSDQTRRRATLLQIAPVEAFGKPAVDRSEKLATIPLVLIAPEPRHAHCRAQFPFCLLRPRDSERAFPISYRIQLGYQPYTAGASCSGLSLFDLRRKLEQQVLLAEAADKLYADR